MLTLLIFALRRSARSISSQSPLLQVLISYRYLVLLLFFPYEGNMDVVNVIFGL